MGQTDGQIALFQNAPLAWGTINKAGIRQSYDGRKLTWEKRRIHVCLSVAVGWYHAVAGLGHDAICQWDSDDPALASCPPSSEVHSARRQQNKLQPDNQTVISKRVGSANRHDVRLSDNVVSFNSAFSALTLLDGRKEGHPACKNLSGYLSGARCRFAYGPADATATHCLLLQ